MIRKEKKKPGRFPSHSLIGAALPLARKTGSLSLPHPAQSSTAGPPPGQPQETIGGKANFPYKGLY